jgi:hypothetical protein
MIVQSNPAYLVSGAAVSGRIAPGDTAHAKFWVSAQSAEEERGGERKPDVGGEQENPFEQPEESA